MTITATRPTPAVPGAVAGTDPHAYRALLTFDHDDHALDRILEQLASWLRPRRIEVDLAGSGFHTTPSGDLMVVHRDSAAGHDFRARLVESTPSGQWTTELTTHLPGKGAGWLTLHVANDRGRGADVPRLAGYLLDVLETRDGAMPLSSQAQVISSGGLEELFDAVCDPDRHGLLMVAGTSPDLPFGPFVDRVRYWTSNIRGMAQAVVLDPPATTAFAALIGDSHAVAPWTLRSFESAVDPAWTPDARRHKVLGTTRLARQPDPALRAFLSRVARSHAATRPTPPAVTRVFRDLARVEDKLFLDALFADPDLRAPAPAAQAPAPPHDAAPAAPTTPPATAVPPAVPTPAAAVPVPPDRQAPAAEPVPVPTSDRDTDGTGVADDAAAYLAQVELTKEVLGLDTLDEPTLAEIAALLTRARRDAASVDRITRELAARQEKIAALEDEVAFHKELYTEEEFERVVAEDERTRAEDEARWLRQQLRSHGDYATAAATVPGDRLTHHPDSFEELLTRLAEVERLGVVFTGDPEVTRALDDVDGNSKIVRATWEALLVVGDYIAARNAGDHDHSIQRYLEHTPSGYRQLSVKKHAPKETASTMQQWSHERVLPVPTDVDPTGRACMEAHFKLGRVGTVSPRMHYLDDYTRTGKVYIGYIGPHLTTGATN